jgi:hypothetical protein
MNRIITSYATGSSQQPFRTASLDFVQDTYRDIVAGLGYSITENIYGAAGLNLPWVLQGCALTSPGGTTYNISAGTMLFKGEVYKVDSTTFSTVLPQTQWIGTYSISYPSYDPTIFSDLTTHNVHQIKKLTFVTGATSSNDLFTYDFVHYLTSVMDQINAYDDSTQTVPVYQPSAFGGFYTASTTEPILVERSKSRVFVSGKVNNTTGLSIGSGTQSMCILPLGYRPSRSFWLHSAGFANFADPTMPLTIGVHPNGEVVLYAPFENNFSFIKFEFDTRI